MLLPNLLIALLFSRVLAFLAEGVGVASLSAYVLSGYILSQPFLGLDMDFDQSLLDLSLITLFFYVGLNVDLRLSKYVFRESLSVSFLGVLTTIALVVLTLTSLGVGLTASLLVGLALSNTATEVVFLVVKPAGLVDENVRKVLTASSFIDDILMIGFISALGVVSSGGFKLVFHVVRQVLLALAVVVLGLLLTRILSRRLFTHRLMVNLAVLTLLSVVLIGCLVGVDLAFSAYFAGVSLGMLRLVRNPMLVNIVRLNDLTQYFSEVLDIFLIPIFSLHVGASLNLTGISVPEFLAVFISAWVGKFAGCSLLRMLRGDLRVGLTYGVVMNARGGLESVFAVLALKYGLLSPTLYGAVVVTAITSSILTPVLVAVMRGYLRGY